MATFGPCSIAPCEVATEEGPRAGLVLSSSTPNPFRDRAVITLTLDAAQAVRAEESSVLGRHVAVLHAAPLPAGLHVLTPDGARLTPGVYVVRVRDEKAVWTRRLVRALLPSDRPPGRV